MNGRMHSFSVTYKQKEYIGQCARDINNFDKSLRPEEIYSNKSEPRLYEYLGKYGRFVVADGTNNQSSYLCAGICEELLAIHVHE